MRPYDRPAARNSFATNGVLVVIYNTAIALLLTAIGFGGGVFVNFVYSQCIGMSVWLLCDGSRRLLWPDRRPPLGPLGLAMGVSVLLAWLGGTWLAALLLGHHWRAQSYLSSLVIASAAGFIATLYFVERERVARLELEAAQEKGRAETIARQAAQARLRLLQAQIEPHFLFNTLANLRAMIPADPQRAQSMLDHLNDFLRATLAAARKERNTLADEFALLRAFLEILAIRMDKRLRFRLDLPAALADIPVPPMLLQPLVENAVKHGLEPKVEGGEIAVTAAAEGGRLVVTVTDTGLGLGTAAPGGKAGGMGTGIAQVRERLESVYGVSASLEIADRIVDNAAAGGVIATLRLPIEAWET